MVGTDSTINYANPLKAFAIYFAVYAFYIVNIENIENIENTQLCNRVNRSQHKFLLRENSIDFH